MSAATASRRFPVNIVFSPSWWFTHYGITFQQPFYLDVQERIADDLRMRRALYDRFGYGAANPQPRGVLGSRHLAGGFVVPALLGVPIRFSDDQAAWPLPIALSRNEVMALRVPNLETTWPMNVLLRQALELQSRFGRVVGDLNTGGLVNTALELRGQQFFIDLVEDPELCDHLLATIADTQCAVAETVRRITGTCSVAVNRSIVDVAENLYLVGNCSVQNISPALYETRVLPFDQRMAARLSPFGIHHCGANLQRYVSAYSQLPLGFLDVGWGSDVARCAAAFPQAHVRHAEHAPLRSRSSEVFLNLRLNPVRMLECSAPEIAADIQQLLASCGRTTGFGLCCINMDADTPDENVRTLLAGGAERS